MASIPLSRFTQTPLFPPAIDRPACARWSNQRPAGLGADISSNQVRAADPHPLAKYPHGSVGPWVASRCPVGRSGPDHLRHTGQPPRRAGAGCVVHCFLPGLTPSGPELHRVNELTRERLSDGRQFTGLGQQFHDVIMRGRGNETVITVVGSLEELWTSHEQRWAAKSAASGEYPSSAERKAVLETHEALAEAIELGCADRARRIAAHHLRKDCLRTAVRQNFRPADGLSSALRNLVPKTCQSPRTHRSRKTRSPRINRSRRTPRACLRTSSKAQLGGPPRTLTSLRITACRCQRCAERNRVALDRDVPPAPP